MSDSDDPAAGTPADAEAGKPAGESPQDAQKRALGEAAAAHVTDGMTIGLGTGSTVTRFAEALGRRIADGLTVRALPTSSASIDLAQRVGIPLVDWNDAARLDLCVDGADEVAPDMSMIKGGGGALLWEKIVAAASARRVYMADASKLVGRLGAFPLPVEVTRFGHQATARHIAALGVEPALRGGASAPFVTDGGNFLYDCAFGEIADPAALEAALAAIPGVVDCGLFVGMVDALIAVSDGAVVEIDGPAGVWWGA